MDPTLLQNLKSASNSADFITAMTEIVEKNDDLFRCEQVRDIVVLEKRSIVEEHQRDDYLVAQVGEFFLWFMPKEGPEAERGQRLCLTAPTISLFTKLLLPNAMRSASVYSVCRSVCRISYDCSAGRDLLTTKEVITLVTACVTRAHTTDSIQFSAGALVNILSQNEAAKRLCFGVEPAASLLQCLRRSREPAAVSWTATALRDIIAFDNPPARKFLCAPESIEILFECLDAAPSQDCMQMICDIFFNLTRKQPDAAEAVATSPGCLDHIMRAMKRAEVPETAQCAADVLTNLIYNYPKCAEAFWSRGTIGQAILDCFSFATTSECCRVLGGTIGNFTYHLKETALFFGANEERIGFLIAALKKSTSADAVRTVAGALNNICVNHEDARNFVATEDAGLVLIDALAFTTDPESVDRLACVLVHSTMSNKDLGRLFSPRATPSASAKLPNAVKNFAKALTCATTSESRLWLMRVMTDLITYFPDHAELFVALDERKLSFQEALLKTKTAGEFVKLLTDHPTLGGEDESDVIAQYKIYQTIFDKCEDLLTIEYEDENENENGQQQQQKDQTDSPLSSFVAWWSAHRQKQRKISGNGILPKEYDMVRLSLLSRSSVKVSADLLELIAAEQQSLRWIEGPSVDYSFSPAMGAVLFDKLTLGLRGATSGHSNLATQCVSAITTFCLHQQPMNFFTSEASAELYKATRKELRDTDSTAAYAILLLLCKNLVKCRLCTSEAKARLRAIFGHMKE